MKRVIILNCGILFFTRITMQFLQSSAILLSFDDLILKKNIAMQIFLMTVITFLPLYFKRNLVEAAENVFNSAAWKLMDSWPSILFNLPKSCTCRSVSLPFPSIILLFPFLPDMGMIMLLKFSHPCVSNLYNKYKMHSHQAINSFNWRQAHLKFYLYIWTELLK